MIYESPVSSLRKLCIGIITTTVLDSYQKMILTGVKKQADRLNIKLISFDAGMIDYNEFSSKNKLKVFDLINPDTVDGILIFPGAFLWDNRAEALEETIKKCADVPVISIGIDLPNIPSIIVDNYNGMCQLFDHLIAVHNCKNILFVKGSGDNPEEIERYRAYKDSLSNHNIPFNEKLVFTGDEESWAGPKAVKHYFDKSIPEIDAIVCSDDANSIFVMVELQRRGFKIPEDIKIGGFDDIELSSVSSPPLTTVNQPLYELGALGLQRICNLISGDKIEVVEKVPTHLVIRQSCGCPHNTSLFSNSDKNYNNTSILNEIDNEFKTILPLSWNDDLKQNVFKDIEKLEKEIFIQLENDTDEPSLEILIKDSIDNYTDYGITTQLWLKVLKKIFQKIYRNNISKQTSYKINYLWKSIILSLHIHENTLHANKEIKNESQSLTNQLLGHRLSANKTLEEVWETLSTQLPNSDINACQVLLYNYKSKSSNQFYSFSNGKTTIRQHVNKKNIKSIEKSLLLESDMSIVVIPIITGHGDDGLVFFEFNEVNVKFEIIAEQISSAMKTIFLLDRINKQNIALQESEAENTRMILNSIEDAVIATDLNGKITGFNSSTEEIFKLKDNIIQKRTIFELLKTPNEIDDYQFKNSFQSIINYGQINNIEKELSIYNSEGEILNLTYEGTPIRNTDENIVGVVIVIKDVTQQNFIQEQLKQTRKMDSLGHLASGIAHDLNNMLTGISGNAILIKHRLSEPEKLTKSADTIIHITDVASELMQNLLSFSRKSNLKARPVNIHECINKSKIILDHSLSKCIDLQLHLGANSYIIMGEAALIQNVIINICINSRDAMPDGGSLSITTKNEHLTIDECEASPFEISPGQYCVLIIKDTGIGIPEKLVNKIFEPFFTTKNIGEGTGLGLSAVYGIVKSHNGSIKIESEINKGTSFIIHLPVRDM